MSSPSCQADALHFLSLTSQCGGVSLWGLGVPQAGISTMGGWWGTVRMTAELSRHCGSVPIKGGGLSLSMFMSNAITRLLLIDVGMALSLWKYLTPLHVPLLSNVANPSPPSLIPLHLQRHRCLH